MSGYPFVLKLVFAVCCVLLIAPFSLALVGADPWLLLLSCYAYAAGFLVAVVAVAWAGTHQASALALRTGKGVLLAFAGGIVVAACWFLWAQPVFG